MRDLIDREKVLKRKMKDSQFYEYVTIDDIKDVPSADIVECARVIKEYCEKYDERCVDCPFNSAKPNKWCKLGCSSLPYEWDLPEGEKGGKE